MVRGVDDEPVRPVDGFILVEVEPNISIPIHTVHRVRAADVSPPLGTSKQGVGKLAGVHRQDAERKILHPTPGRLPVPNPERSFGERPRGQEAIRAEGGEGGGAEGEQPLEDSQASRGVTATALHAALSVEADAESLRVVRLAAHAVSYRFMTFQVVSWEGGHLTTSDETLPESRSDGCESIEKRFERDCYKSKTRGAAPFRLLAMLAVVGLFRASEAYTPMGPLRMEGSGAIGRSPLCSLESPRYFSPAMSQAPEPVDEKADKALKAMVFFANSYCKNTGTTYCSDPSIPAVRCVSSLRAPFASPHHATRNAGSQCHVILVASHSMYSKDLQSIK
ncbi:MAG: hypothetical protein SGPRY_005987 [Prymnesium sp.]